MIEKQNDETRVYRRRRRRAQIARWRRDDKLARSLASLQKYSV